MQNSADHTAGRLDLDEITGNISDHLKIANLTLGKASTVISTSNQSRWEGSSTEIDAVLIQTNRLHQKLASIQSIIYSSLVGRLTEGKVILHPDPSQPQPSQSPVPQLEVSKAADLDSIIILDEESPPLGKPRKTTQRIQNTPPFGDQEKKRANGDQRSRPDQIPAGSKKQKISSEEDERSKPKPSNKDPDSRLKKHRVDQSKSAEKKTVPTSPQARKPVPRLSDGKQNLPTKTSRGPEEKPTEPKGTSSGRTIIMKHAPMDAKQASVPDNSIDQRLGKDRTSGV